MNANVFSFLIPKLGNFSFCSFELCGFRECGYQSGDVFSSEHGKNAIVSRSMAGTKQLLCPGAQRLADKKS